MTGEVVKFKPVLLGEGVRLDIDEMLEELKGQGFQTICVLAEDEDGEFKVFGNANANAGETLVLIERAKHQIVLDRAEHD